MYQWKYILRFSIYICCNKGASQNYVIAGGGGWSNLFGDIMKKRAKEVKGKAEREKEWKKYVLEHSLNTQPSVKPYSGCIHQGHFLGGEGGQIIHQLSIT